VNGISGEEEKSGGGSRVSKEGGEIKLGMGIGIWTWDLVQEIFGRGQENEFEACDGLQLGEIRMDFRVVVDRRALTRTNPLRCPLRMSCCPFFPTGRLWECDRKADSNDLWYYAHAIVEGETMPLVRIDLVRGKPKAYLAKVGQIVYQAMVDVIKVPLNDRFQIITEHALEELAFDREYLGVHRSDECIFIQVSMSKGRTTEMKQRFYRAVADGLNSELKLRREDVFINLVEVEPENWSFGNGEAQYVK
jgi:phenylpyruvate tautomerase PptA (4-oxalocrotonate tautomerase family)